MNPQDPLTLLFFIVVAIVVIIGFYYALRELGADAILLADKKREMQKRNEKKKPL